MSRSSLERSGSQVGATFIPESPAAFSCHSQQKLTSTGHGTSCKVLETFSTGKISKCPKTFRSRLPVKPKVGTAKGSCPLAHPTDAQISREGGAAVTPNPQVTGQGWEVSGRVRLHLPAPPRPAPTQLAPVLPASHCPPSCSELPAADEGQSFQGLCR